MRRAAAIALLLGACAPPLQSDYVCARLECPPGWTCWADGRCRDHEPAAQLGEACSTDDECSTRLCASGLDPRNLSSGRYCSTACERDEECMGWGEAGAHCVQGACRAACQNHLDCPEGTDTTCHYPVPEPGFALPNGAVCFQLMNTLLNGSQACTSNGMMGEGACVLPGWCVQLGGTPGEIGLCSMLCEVGPLTNQCPMMRSECVELVPGFGQCMIPCPGGADDCADPDLDCVAHGNGNSYCMPATWTGLPRTSGTVMDLVPPPPT